VYLQRFAAWIEAEQGRFFLILPIAMGAAILAYFDLKSEPPLWLGFCLAAASALALAASWRLPPARFIAALALAASLGFARAEWRTAAMPPLLDVPYGSVIATGSISSIDNLPTGRRITLAPAALDGGPPLARVLRIKLSAHDTTMLAPGDVVALRAILFKPDRPAYPGGWDATRDAYFAGLGASGFELGTLTVTNPATGQGFSVWLRGVRENIAASINASLPPPTASVAVTLLTGLENQMPPDERQQFIAAGLAHLLAVAGLHVGIVMGLFFAAARFCLTRHERIALHLPVKPIAACVALAAGGMYAALTGAHLPILRSLAMAGLVTAGVIAGRRAEVGLQLRPQVGRVEHGEHLALVDVVAFLDVDDQRRFAQRRLQLDVLERNDQAAEGRVRRHRAPSRRHDRDMRLVDRPSRRSAVAAADNNGGDHHRQNGQPPTAWSEAHNQHCTQNPIRRLR